MRPFPHPRPVRLAAIAALACAAATAPSAQAPAPEQPPQPPTFRLEANFVRVDVYPTADGSPVRDLTRADFQVLEDGVPQEIETFEQVALSRGVPVEQRRDPGSVSQMRAEAENPRARLFVIFLDTAHTDVAGSHRMQRTLVTMLDRMLSPDDLFAVMTQHMSPTDLAFARKSDTVEGYLRRHWAWGERDRMMPTDPAEQMLVQCFPAGINPGSNSRLISELAEELIARRREKVVLDALTDLTLYLRGLREERKAVITISNGWMLPGEQPALLAAGRPPAPPRIGTTPAGRITVDRERDQFGTSEQQCERERQLLAFTNFRQEFYDLMETANRGNVSFYPVDSRGLAASDSPVFVLSDKTPAQEVRLVQTRVESLRTLAENTDGLAVVDTNALEKGVSRIVDDMTSYYLLGYYSSNAKLDGRYRKITVRVTRPGVEVRARRGYKAATAEEMATRPPSSAAAGPPPALRAALAAVASSRPAALRSSISLARRGHAAAGPVRVWATVELDAASLKGDFARGGEIAVIAAGGDGSVLAQGRAVLAPGTRAAVVDLGELATLDGDLVVRSRARPTGDGAPLTDTVTVSGAAQSGASAMLWRRGPSTAMHYVPTADARFSRADRVRADVPVQDASAAVSARLLDRAGGEIALPVTTSTRTEGPQTWATAELALAPLAPAEYVLKLTVAGPDGPRDVYTGIRVVR